MNVIAGRRGYSRLQVLAEASASGLRNKHSHSSKEEHKMPRQLGTAFRCTSLAGLLVTVATTACANSPSARMPTSIASAPAIAPATDFDATVPTAWFDLQLKLVKETPGFTPPVAGRVFGYTGVALYESDHLLICSERQLLRIAKAYVAYFNEARPHQGLHHDYRLAA
jgi:hypothetical protein